jgi:protein-L-isoaspartate(D-aspartate) O-methyltransferase
MVITWTLRPGRCRGSGRRRVPVRRPPGTLRLVSPGGPEQLARVVRATGVRDRRVLEAIAAIPRARFVPADCLDRAYADEPIPIPHGQVTTQPSLVARMLEALALEGTERVLEVGTGYGFQTALLARLATKVVSIERFADVAQGARVNLERQGARNAEVLVGDGTEGVPAWAPFDAIVVSAAFTSVPQPLCDQLAVGGRLVQPMGPGGRDLVMAFERGRNGLQPRAEVTWAYFVKLYGVHGFAARE